MLFCGRCGMPTAFEAFVCDEGKGVDFGFNSARDLLRYTSVGKEIVHTMKYQGYIRIVPRLAAPLMLGVLDSQDLFDAVVPLHCSRLMRRGFNQAKLLARAVAGDTFGCVQSQGPCPGRVLLVDDVFTTGATMSACAEALFRAGAEEVHALSLCRTC
jgi:competence protein ComFC